MKYTLKDGKDIEIKEKNRKAHREYNELLLGGAMVGSTGDFQVDAGNVEKANDLLVKSLSGLSQDEIDELSMDEFDDILSIINKENMPSGKPITKDTK